MEGKGKQKLVKKGWVGDVDADAESSDDYDSEYHQMGYNFAAEDDVFSESSKKKKLLIVGGGERKGPSNIAGGGGMRCCQADKCSSDLSAAKPYHKRHKVCEYHSKSQVVLVAGMRQRFCQQCSRFHELSEFDDMKRSCRRRLAGHNERRRKNAGGAESQHQHHQHEGSSRKGVGEEIMCGDHRGRIKIQEINPNYKHFQIR